LDNPATVHPKRERQDVPLHDIAELLTLKRSTVLEQLLNDLDRESDTTRRGI